MTISFSTDLEEMVGGWSKSERKYGNQDGAKSIITVATQIGTEFPSQQTYLLEILAAKASDKYCYRKPIWSSHMRIREITAIKPKPLIQITKLEDPLKRQAGKLRDKADQLTDQSKERKKREELDKARENLRDKERKIAEGAPK